MRYQERIYIQNDNSCVRNKDILNVNMSSDMCTFISPLFSMSGASKLDCVSGFTGTSHVISTGTTIPLGFDFTANTNTFTATNATFKYEIYKYNSEVNQFLIPSVYKSDIFEYSGFSATSIINESIPISGLSLDGEYIVKGFYVFDVCTDFLNRLGKKVDTLSYIGGTSYGIYDVGLDNYFIATTSASTPNFLLTPDNTPPPNNLFQEVILPVEGQTVIIITSSYLGEFVLTLNGLTLAPDLDYTYTGNVVTLSAETVSDDIITVIYTTGVGNNLTSDTIFVTSPVVSGTTDNEGSNLTYFNTTTSKYEVYTLVTPYANQSIIVMLNGATLANGVDFYQSISNPKRIILEGNILIGDVITIAYFATTNTIDGLITNLPVVTWAIAIPPQLVNGIFTLEASTASTFSDIYYSGVTEYIVGQTAYSASFPASGEIGTELYYRVKNEKNYVTICNNIINTVAYSEIIPLIVETNAINSY